ncbi:hypothetical protein H6P81_015963 [Aristolochia fimbriata]|uniref:Uncharacterized protein n=1 Tax=Aristolochia fimbriata TaxID=158543 RepID=A0AAV7E720_ARIFI|nr:hypothetical protein H6P81_015963 [Aristolochia fimbriata]
MGAAMRLGRYLGDGESDPPFDFGVDRPAGPRGDQAGRMIPPADRRLCDRGGWRATSRTCPRGTCALLASASGLPIRPVLKHGPRSLTCVRVSGRPNPLPTLESGSAGGRVQRLEEHRRVAWCPSRPATLENPEDRVPPALVVLITASGLQGKGSRQNGSVTGKGLALEGWARGPSPEPVGCRWTARAAPAARRVVSVPGGGRTGNGPFGAFPASNSPTQN